jgi:putative transposase
VRNGHAQPRQVLTSAGAMEVAAPRVNDKRVDETTGERRRSASAILPAWCRKSPKITEVLPLLYLHGLSSKDFVPALESFLGTGSGLSAAVVTRLTVHGATRPARSTTAICPLWTTSICGPMVCTLNVRLDEEKLCLVVMIGVRVDGTKELLALAEGYRESAGSWADLLRDCKRRGMRAPILAVGDGALGFWPALREVFLDTREQRCWFHKIANVLAALPKSAHPGAKRALAEIWNAEDREHARRAVAAFKLAYAAKFGKAVAKVTDHCAARPTGRAH